MNSLYPLLTGRFIEGRTDLDRLITPAILHIFRRTTLDYMKNCNCPPLSSEQRHKIRDFYGRYTRVDPLYHRVYTGRSGQFFTEYMPDDIYFGRIEPFYTDRLCSRALDNKCYYYSFFSNVKLPRLIVMRIGSNWVDANLRLISFRDACELVGKEQRCVAKRALYSEGGYGLAFLEGEEAVSGFKRFVRKNNTDIVVQAVIDQHPEYSRLHPQSVNTVRLMSLLTPEGVKVFAGAVRIGTGASRVDNLAVGGVFCGLDGSGNLSRIGVLNDGGVVTSHPELGYSFEGIRLPYYDRAVELVERAHGIMAHCRLASWDVAIDSEGDAVLIETNLSLGTIHSMQVCCGPIFGEDTRKILDEVYFDKKGRKRRKPYLGLNPRDYYYLRDNLLGILRGYYKPGYTHIQLLGNTALRVIDKKLIDEVSGLYPELTDEQKQETRDYYRPYVRRVNTDSHKVYSGKSGRFYPDYIPEDMYMCDIDRYLSDRETAYYLDNKCYYYRLFAGIRQPEAVVMRINGIWMDADYRVIDKKAVAMKLFAADSIVVKAANGSEGGVGVTFLELGRISGRREKISAFSNVLRGMKNDIIVQKTIGQYAPLKALHPESLNTYRIISLLIDGGVRIIDRCLKIGVGSSRVDNGSSGGIFCGVMSNDTLGPIGTFMNGRVIKRHPDLGYLIEGTQAYHIKECEELVQRAHPVLGHHRLVSWDVAVDESGSAVLIEANLALGGSDQVQAVCGPFFGKYTGAVLKEVYGDRKALRQNK